MGGPATRPVRPAPANRCGGLGSALCWRGSGALHELRSWCLPAAHRLAQRAGERLVNASHLRYAHPARPRARTDCPQRWRAQAAILTYVLLVGGVLLHLHAEQHLRRGPAAAQGHPGPQAHNKQPAQLRLSRQRSSPSLCELQPEAGTLIWRARPSSRRGHLDQHFGVDEDDAATSSRMSYDHGGAAVDCDEEDGLLLPMPPPASTSPHGPPPPQQHPLRSKPSRSLASRSVDQDRALSRQGVIRVSGHACLILDMPRFFST